MCIPHDDVLQAWSTDDAVGEGQGYFRPVGESDASAIRYEVTGCGVTGAVG